MSVLPTDKKKNLSNYGNIILGGGMSGLAIGAVSGLPVYEAAAGPGGICSSYYLRPGTTGRLPLAPDDGNAYRFENGGGHWLFGADPAVLRFMRGLTPLKSYERRSGVYFSRQKLFVPYPLQDHLGFLNRRISVRASAEMSSPPAGDIETMADWIKGSFGGTLTGLFFGPFHERYTAGLWRRIAPQDAFKSPSAKGKAARGAAGKIPSAGYNAEFVYPADGLDVLAGRMAGRCRIFYGKKAVRVDTNKRSVGFADGSETRYDKLISTLPLNRMMELTGLPAQPPADPYTSVLVLNIGAARGRRTPGDHWLYTPDSGAGFHRVGFYSNVDVSFLPASSRAVGDRVGIYVERAYPGGARPDGKEVNIYSRKVLRELREWGFIGQVEAMDPTWIDVAYTWTWPGSKWRAQAITALEEQGVYQIGRYGRWSFQGIADSIRDGLKAGAAFR